MRNLALAYTLAGADCIDVAADPAVIAAAQVGIQIAEKLADSAQRRGFRRQGLPWLMVSLNDGEDPHFRKAEFNATECPTKCPRPCESICPAAAIVFNQNSCSQSLIPFSGVIDELCYGCGRCLPVCPSQLIFTRSYVSTPQVIAPLVLQTGIDALEIHTQVGRLADFQRLWGAIAPWVHKLKLLAISCPDGEGLIDYLRSLYDLISPLPCPLIWQTDGRPMSGDIGGGTTRVAIKLGQKVLAAGLPGYVQLAGGTNDRTVPKLKSLGLVKEKGKRKKEKEGGLNSKSYSPIPDPQALISGVAYGSYARVLLSSVLAQVETANWEEAYTSADPITKPKQTGRLEDSPSLLWEAVAIAHSLVSQLKTNGE